MFHYGRGERDEIFDFTVKIIPFVETDYFQFRGLSRLRSRCLLAKGLWSRWSRPIASRRPPKRGRPHRCKGRHPWPALRCRHLTEIALRKK